MKDYTVPFHEYDGEILPPHMFIEIPSSNPERAQVLFYILTRCRPHSGNEPWEWRHYHNTHFSPPTFDSTSLVEIYIEFMELLTAVEHPDPPHIVLRFIDDEFTLSVEKYLGYFETDYEKEISNLNIISQEEAMEYLLGIRNSYLCNNMGLMVPVIYHLQG